MNQENHLTVPGRYDQVRLICDFVAEGARLAHFDDKTIFHIELACDEACTNIIEHAYGGEEQGNIEATWQIDSQQFVITLADTGRPFDPDSVPEPMTPDAASGKLDELKVGGLGLHFMKKLMDEVHFAFTTEKGNQLIMTKYLRGNA